MLLYHLDHPMHPIHPINCAHVKLRNVRPCCLAVFSLFVGIPRCHAYKDANWQELAKNPQLQSPILDRTFGPQGRSLPSFTFQPYSSR